MDIIIGKYFIKALTPSTGSAPFVYKLESGSLPEGLLFNKEIGMIRGMPKKVGIYQFTISVKDSNDIEGSTTFTLVIKPSPSSMASESWVESPSEFILKEIIDDFTLETDIDISGVGCNMDLCMCSLKGLGIIILRLYTEDNKYILKEIIQGDSYVEYKDEIEWKFPFTNGKHHLLMKRDKINLYLYVDGRLISQRKRNSGLLDLTKGKNGYCSFNLWSDNESKIKIKDVKLSQPLKGLGYWPCLEGRGNTLNDLSSNQNHLQQENEINWTLWN